jgi:hypothetical protein
MAILLTSFWTARLPTPDHQKLATLATLLTRACQKLTGRVANPVNTKVGDSGDLGILLLSKQHFP